MKVLLTRAHPMCPNTAQSFVDCGNGYGVSINVSANGNCGAYSDASRGLIEVAIIKFVEPPIVGQVPAFDIARDLDDEQIVIAWLPSNELDSVIEQAEAMHV